MRDASTHQPLKERRPTHTIPFSARLKPEVIARIRALSKTKKNSVSNALSLALDAQDRMEKLGFIVPDRVAFLEKCLAGLQQLVIFSSEKLDEKFSEASTLERERLKSLYKLLDIKLCEHDEAEAERFYRFAAGIRGDGIR
jgi:hypothetical protein